MSVRIYRDRLYVWTQEYQGISGFRRHEPMLCAVLGSHVKTRAGCRRDELRPFDYNDGRKWRIEDGHLPEFQPIAYSPYLLEAMQTHGAVSAVEIKGGLT